MGSVQPLVAVHAIGARALEVIVFAGGANWPLWVGIEKGCFAAHGLKVNITPTPNSVYQIRNLVAGKFDIAFSSFDNVVAYDEGQGEAALDRPADLFAFMGGLGGGVRLVAHPDIRSIADLKGKSLAVDAATTGYAFVLRKILQQGGLSDADYRLEPLGGTAARAEALMENRTVGTILTSPIDIAVLAKGYRRLANAVDVIGPYQSTLGVARRDWARTHAAELVGFIRGYRDALDWLVDPAHRDEAVAIYRKQLPKASEESARRAWDALLGGSEGIQKDGRLDLAGARTVLALRSEFGRPRKTLSDPSKYIDESYYLQASSR